ncbi:antitoxin HicB [Rathayibacter soli]|uniref:antitoxin HicB n=1 Tax=Rathayibacter soli TaxID=3144168 RepID=UPI0027E4C75B|nr:antitoxin HicB [Glaciibacter superstes]
MAAKTVPRQLEATATREGRWWFIDIPELGTGGQARSVREIDSAAAEIASLWLDVDTSDVQVNVTIRVPADAQAAWQRAQEIEIVAREAQAEAAMLKRTAVHALRADGYTLDAAARAFKISTQRAHQLAQ